MKYYHLSNDDPAPDNITIEVPYDDDFNITDEGEEMIRNLSDKTALSLAEPIGFNDYGAGNEKDPESAKAFIIWYIQGSLLDVQAGALELVDENKKVKQLGF